MGYFKKRSDTDTLSPSDPVISVPRLLSTPIPPSLSTYDYLLPPASAPVRGPRGRPSTRDISLTPLLSISISPDELANFLEIDPRVIESICNDRWFKKNYCRRGKGKGAAIAIGLEGVRKILRDLHELSGRPVDRVSLLLWMVGSKLLVDAGGRESRDCKPFYDSKVESEIERIAKLEQPARTAMAIELLERYRDAMAVAEAIAEAGDTDTEAEPETTSATATDPPADGCYWDKVNRMRREKEWAKKLASPEIARARKFLDKPVKTRKDEFRGKLEKMAEGR